MKVMALSLNCRWGLCYCVVSDTDTARNSRARVRIKSSSLRASVSSRPLSTQSLPIFFLGIGLNPDRIRT